MISELPDFDTLMEMAKSNPEGLAKLREQHIQHLIENATPELQNRLRGLQFQIDAKRKISGTPLNACIEISQMMHQSFFELRKALNEGMESEQPAQPENTASAKILSFEAPAAVH